MSNTWWVAELKFSAKLGVFEYSACHENSKGVKSYGFPGIDKIIILEGDIADYDQVTRNRARLQVRRLVNTLNDLKFDERQAKKSR